MLAITAFPRSRADSVVPILSSLRSTSVSILLTKNEATDAIGDRSWPAAAAFSMPVMNASMTWAYRSSPKISVTLTLIPSDRHCVIAGRPCRVAGILMNRFGRSASHHSARASAMVLPGSSVAILGSASSDTQPSTPPVASYTGRSTSHAQRMS